MELTILCKLGFEDLQNHLYLSQAYSEFFIRKIWSSNFYNQTAIQ